ncbi:hypothetical protein ABPG77_002919, partial [Micractinium sp. CCAP 211/92]
WNKCVRWCPASCGEKNQRLATRYNRRWKRRLRLFGKRHAASLRAAAACKLEGMDVEEYVDSFSPGLMDVVAAWCRGVPFVTLYKMTDVFEGSLVRAIRRLEELLRQLAGALHTVGDLELEEKFKAAIERVKRDIVFAASLYL